MGYFNDLTLSYTAEDARLDRLDGIITTTTYDWPAIIRLYELHCQCGYYNARADVERRRAENGDDEAARWFERVGAGERLTWNTKA